MNYNIFYPLLLSTFIVLLGCKSSNYNMMQDSPEPEKLTEEELKLELYKNCKACPSCKSDYRYFHVCSHGAILIMCNECYSTYDVACEVGLRDKKHEHQIKMYECFNEDSRLATEKDLEKAGLIDFVNKVALLDEYHQE
jgi:hypothetical protein